MTWARSNVALEGEYRMERERLDTLINIVERSQDMCPACKELFDQIAWGLMQEFEKAISSKRKRRSTSPKSLSESKASVVWSQEDGGLRLHSDV